MEMNKLVRDRIPEIIRSDGRNPITYIASAEEYARRLHEKLQEEVNEYITHPCDEELADILEVMHALSDMKEVERVRQEKRAARGGFDDHIVLERIEDTATTTHV